MKGKLFVYRDGIESSEATWNFMLHSEEVAKKGYEVEIVDAEESADVDAEINAVMIPTIVPRIELEDGRHFEGIRSIERFFKDFILN